MYPTGLRFQPAYPTALVPYAGPDDPAAPPKKGGKGGKGGNKRLPVWVIPVAVGGGVLLIGLLALFATGSKPAAPAAGPVLW